MECGQPWGEWRKDHFRNRDKNESQDRKEVALFKELRWGWLPGSGDLWGAQYCRLGWGKATLGEAGIQDTGGQNGNEQAWNLFHEGRRKGCA